MGRMQGDNAGGNEGVPHTAGRRMGSHSVCPLHLAGSEIEFALGYTDREMGF
jgi:hypothetical protein